MSDELTEKVAAAIIRKTGEVMASCAPDGREQVAQAAIVAVLEGIRKLPDDPVGADIVEAVRLVNGEDGRPDAWDYDDWLAAFCAGLDALLSHHKEGAE